MALSLTSLTATGNVVANFSQTSKGLGGIFLFVFGIAGLVFNLRKKKGKGKKTKREKKENIKVKEDM